MPPSHHNNEQLGSILYNTSAYPPVNNVYDALQHHSNLSQRRPIELQAITEADRLLSKDGADRVIWLAILYQRVNSANGHH